jgi:hypothetical protein
MWLKIDKSQRDAAYPVPLGWLEAASFLNIVIALLG